MSPAVWSFLSVLVPVVLLTIAAMLLAYGLVVWCHRVELRQRHADVTYRRPMDRWTR